MTVASLTQATRSSNHGQTFPLARCHAYITCILVNTSPEVCKSSAFVECRMQEVRIGEQLEQSEENVFVGGENKWRYVGSMAC